MATHTEVVSRDVFNAVVHGYVQNNSASTLPYSPESMKTDTNRDLTKVNLKTGQTRDRIICLKLANAQLSLVKGSKRLVSFKIVYVILLKLLVKILDAL